MAMERAYYRISEVAEILGLGKSITYRLVASGEIPSLFIAGLRSRRIPADALKKWIEEENQRAVELQSDGVDHA